MGATEFIRKHTRHMTPVLIIGLACVGAPFLVTLDENLSHLFDRLGKGEIVTLYDFYRPWVKAFIVGVGALGGFVSRAVDDRRQKLKAEGGE